VRRRLFNLAAAMSLVLCAVFILMWARSRRISERVAYCGFSPQGMEYALQAFSDQGGFGFQYERAAPPQPATARSWSYAWDPANRYPYDPRRGIAGFEFRHDLPVAGSIIQRHRLLFRCPYWFGLAVGLLPPTLATRNWRRPHHRRKRGLCVHCGYDLRATPQEGGVLLERCPECGTEAKPQLSAS
jgi:hypothetical protein